MPRFADFELVSGFEVGNTVLAWRAVSGSRLPPSSTQRLRSETSAGVERIRDYSGRRSQLFPDAAPFVRLATPSIADGVALELVPDATGQRDPPVRRLPSYPRALQAGTSVVEMPAWPPMQAPGAGSGMESPGGPLPQGWQERWGSGRRSAAGTGSRRPFCKHPFCARRLRRPASRRAPSLRRLD
jgi:hypothetical protein